MGFKYINFKKYFFDLWWWALIPTSNFFKHPTSNIDVPAACWSWFIFQKYTPVFANTKGTAAKEINKRKREDYFVLNYLFILLICLF